MRGPRDHPHLAIDYGFLKANNPDDPADQGSNPILTGDEAKCGRTLSRWQFRERVLLHHGLRSVWRIGWIVWAAKRSS